MTEQFPKWAPVVLIERYKELRTPEEQAAHYGDVPGSPGYYKTLRYQKSRIAAFKPLITHAGMKKVWEQTAKKNDEAFPYRLRYEVERAYFSCLLDNETRQDEATRHKGYAKQARRLAEALHHSELDVSVYKLLPDEAKKEFVDAYDLTQCPDYPGIKHQLSDYDNPTPAQVIDAAFFRWPQVSHALCNLAELADKMAIEAMERKRYSQGRGALESSHKRHQQRIFVRQMAEFFYLEMGRPQYDFIASVTNAVLCTSLKKDNIRDRLSRFDFRTGNDG